MAASINQIIRQRKSAYREFKRSMRRLDTVQEAVERKIDQVLRLKRSVPDNQDYTELITGLRDIGSANDDLLNLAIQYQDVFA